MQKSNLTATALGVLARRVLSVAALPLLACASASAATYTWDPAANGVGSDGSGPWSTAIADWATGTGDIAWPVSSSDTANIGSGGSGGTITVSGGVSVGGIKFNTPYIITGSTITLSSAVSITANAPSTIASTLTGSGSLTVNGTNKLSLTGVNDYTGGTTITDGILDLQPGASLGTGAVSNQSFLSVNTGTGTMTLANAISGAGGITKIGTGTLVVSGTSTYSGTALISAGKLVLDGTVTASSPTTQSQIVVGNGATLAGTGSFSGATSGALTMVAGGVIAPGDNLGDFGTLSLNSWAWTSNNTAASLFFDLSTSSSACDMVAVSGTFIRGAANNGTTSGSYIFDFGGGGMYLQTYTLVTFGTNGNTTNPTSVSNLVASNLAPNLRGVFTVSGNSLKVTVVPEPSQVGFAFMAFAALAILMRRNRGSLGMACKKIMNKQMTRNAMQVLLAIASIAFGTQSADARLVTIKLESATFDDLQKAMNAGALTSQELATLYLNRRAAYDQNGIKLNSVVAISPTLITDAAAADAARAGGASGPLLGLMFCTKDSYPTINMVQSGGVKSWLSPVTGTVAGETTTYGPNIPNYDCYLVQKLKAAGAVQLGHGNMDTWATSAGSTTSNAYGTTTNAYTLGSSSGSSGGPGCLTGSNFASFAWGGETGGSIRNPSDRAGITGFKVGVGTESINDIIPLSADHDVVGPMAKYVLDEAYIMDATATTQDPNDPWAGHAHFNLPLPSGYHAGLASASLAGKTIAIIGTYNDLPRPIPAPTPVQLPGIGMTAFPTTSSSNTTGTQTTDPAIKTIFSRAVSQLQALGATVVTVYLPPNLDTSVALPPYDDSVSGSHPAPLRSAMTGSPTSNQILAWMNAGYLDANLQGIWTRLTQANAASSSLSTTVRGLAYNRTFSTYNDAGVQPFFAAQQIYETILNTWMDSNNIDAFVWPISFAKTRSSNSVVGRDLINNLGNPIITVPMGIIPQTGEPTCMGFYGKYRHENDLLALAYAYQSHYNYRVPSPLTPPLDGETITYDDGSAILFAKRADKLPPIVSIKKKAKVDGSSVLIEGVADDASGIGTIKVYVNGRKVPAKLGKKWVAKVSVADFKKWAKSSKGVDVTVVVKDTAGNSTATVKSVKI